MYWFFCRSSVSRVLNIRLTSRIQLTPRGTYLPNFKHAERFPETQFADYICAIEQEPLENVRGTSGLVLFFYSSHSESGLGSDDWFNRLEGRF